jgi:hypothetical protein
MSLFTGQQNNPCHVTLWSRVHCFSGNELKAGENIIKTIANHFILAILKMSHATIHPCLSRPLYPEIFA